MTEKLIVQYFSHGIYLLAGRSRVDIIRFRLATLWPYIECEHNDETYIKNLALLLAKDGALVPSTYRSCFVVAYDFSTYTYLSNNLYRLIDEAIESNK